MEDMDSGSETEVLTVLAPAKVNLTLEVMAKHLDGFHEIRSVAQTINLCDSLRFHPARSLEFRCDRDDWSAGESLISRAAALLLETTGAGKGAVVEVTKRIPMVAGLGGDSSGAAAVLRGLNKLWGLGLSQEALLALASRLGSDVAFFLYGGTALLEGRGEVLTPLPPFPQRWVVLMVPPLPRTPGKTGRLYSRLEAAHHSRGEATEGMVAWLNAGGEGTASLFNVFDAVAIESFPGLGEYWRRFKEAVGGEVHLVGSGPTLFTLLADRLQAETVHRKLHQEGLESYLTDTSGAMELR